MWRVCNHTSALVSVAIQWFDPDACGGEGQDWNTRGWYNIAPGACANVLADLDNRWVYYFAMSDDGSVWAGPFATMIPDEAFERCIGIATTADHQRGFRELDVDDNDDFTLNLVP